MPGRSRHRPRDLSADILPQGRVLAEEAPFTVQPGANGVWTKDAPAERAVAGAGRWDPHPWRAIERYIGPVVNYGV